MAVSRRGFLKLMAGAGAAATVATQPGDAKAAADFHGWEGRYGVLCDTSMCIGCRSCEQACHDVNSLPDQPKPFDDLKVLDEHRRLDHSRFTVVNKYSKEETGVAETFIKTQCMHCDEPACFAACLAKAFTKTPEGAVVYASYKCIGCRYCMQACPFYVPAYEYHDALTPRVRKCTMCFERIAQEKPQRPGCVATCPTGALIFGDREYLIKVARERIAKDDAYQPHIYGEKEVGGTCWMYISKAPFEKLGLPAHLGTSPLPKKTYGYLATIPVMHIGLPVLLTGFYLLTRDQGKGGHQ